MSSEHAQTPYTGPNAAEIAAEQIQLAMPDGAKGRVVIDRILNTDATGAAGVSWFVVVFFPPDYYATELTFKDYRGADLADIVGNACRDVLDIPYNSKPGFAAVCEARR